MSKIEIVIYSLAAISEYKYYDNLIVITRVNTGSERDLIDLLIIIRLYLASASNKVRLLLLSF